MLHTVKIDDSTPLGKKILQDLSQYKTEVQFEEPMEVKEAPAGYMTGDEFVKQGKETIAKYYKDNGLL